MSALPSEPPDPLRPPGAPPPVCNRGPRDPHFAGRDTELEEVSGLLARRPVLLRDAPGLDRSGKSAFALEYCHRFGQRYTVIWWFDCQAEDGLRPQYEALAKRLGARAGRARSGGGGGLLSDQWWLLVFDGVRTAGELDGGLPEGTGHVLVTYGGDGDGVAGAEPYPLGPLTREESIMLLMTKNPALDPVQADRIAAALGHRPGLIGKVGDLMLANPDLSPKAGLALIAALAGARGGPASPAQSLPAQSLPAQSLPAQSLPAQPPPDRLGGELGGPGPEPGESVAPHPSPPAAARVPNALLEQLVQALYEVEALSHDGVATWIRLIEDQRGPLDIGGTVMTHKLAMLIRRCLRHEDAAMLDEMVAALRVLASNDPALPRVTDLVRQMRDIRFP